MKTEYIFVKTRDDFCIEIGQFKSLLMTNTRITMSAEDAGGKQMKNASCESGTLKFKETSFRYTVKCDEVDKTSGTGKQGEVMFHLTVSADSSDDATAAALEELDQLLHRINQQCGDQFTVNTIWDDVSLFYAEKLYSPLAEIENLLRKIIYCFMIKTAGSKWFSNTVPKKVKEAVKNTMEKNRVKLDEVPEDQLYYADFIHLGAFFFTPYSLRPDGQDAVKEIKALRETEEAEKIHEKISELLEYYEARSNWDRYFADKIEVDELYKKWQTLYNYRNQVAHSKRVKKADYDKAMELIDELRPAFESCLEQVDSVELTEEQTRAVEQVATEFVDPSLSWVYNLNPASGMLEFKRQPVNLYDVEKGDISYIGLNQYLSSSPLSGGIVTQSWPDTFTSYRKYQPYNPLSAEYLNSYLPIASAKQDERKADDPPQAKEQDGAAQPDKKE